MQRLSLRSNAMRGVLTVLCIVALLAAEVHGKVDARRRRQRGGDEEEEVSNVVYYGKLLLGLSPIIAIFTFAFCHKDSAEEEAVRSAKKDHCST